MNPKELFGKDKDCFVLVTEIINVGRAFGAENKGDIKKIFDWLEKFGGKKGYVIWNRTGKIMRCFHGIYIKDMIYEDKETYSHIGKGCEKILEKGDNNEKKSNNNNM